MGNDVPLTSGLSWDDFDVLRARIEEQGGVLLDELCEQRVHLFPDPSLAGVRGAVGFFGPTRSFAYADEACGHHTVFELPYVVQKPSIREGKPLVTGKVKLCAVCDDLRDLPRFRGE